MQIVSLLKNFENARNSIIDSIFEYIQKLKNQSLFLSESPSYRVADGQQVIKHIYKKLFISENKLYIEYGCCRQMRFMEQFREWTNLNDKIHFL